MRDRLQQLRARQHRYQECFHTDKTAIDARNANVLSVSLLSGIVIFAFVLCASFFVSLYEYLRVAYIVALCLQIGLFILVKRAKRAPVTALMYTSYCIWISYSCITSAFVSPDYVCVTILAFIFVFPVLYIDKGWRILLVTVLAVCVYLAVISRYKDPVLFVDEVINCCSFALLALIIGAFMRRMQLENLEMKRMLSSIAYTDHLTGLGNRRAFFERLAECERPDCPEPIVAFAMLDLDGFKQFNDSFGHQAGDDCLQAVGACLAAYETSDDVRFYRYGGEEFIGVSGSYGAEKLEALCERVRKDIAAIRIEGADGVTITVSVGVAAFDGEDERRYASLLAAADIALYAAKDMGKDRTVIYTPALEDTAMAAGFRYSFRRG